MIDKALISAPFLFININLNTLLFLISSFLYEIKLSSLVKIVFLKKIGAKLKNYLNDVTMNALSKVNNYKLINLLAIFRLLSRVDK